MEKGGIPSGAFFTNQVHRGARTVGVVARGSLEIYDLPVAGKERSLDTEGGNLSGYRDRLTNQKLGLVRIFSPGQP